MSTTTTTPVQPAVSPAVQTALTDNAIKAARSGAELLQNLQTSDPALYQQLTGSFATYGKSAAAPIVGGVLAWGVAKIGLGPYVTADTLNLVTEVLVALGTGAGALVMHYFSKAPARKMAAPAAAPTAASAP